MNASMKLSAAQAELQACEAHLAARERELDERRASAVGEGLSARCKAMIECGWAWGEMGKEGLRALETALNPRASDGHGESHFFLCAPSLLPLAIIHYWRRTRDRMILRLNANDH